MTNFLCKLGTLFASI